jgi:hypothetical protein
MFLHEGCTPPVLIPAIIRLFFTITLMDFTFVGSENVAIGISHLSYSYKALGGSLGYSTYQGG